MSPGWAYVPVPSVIADSAETQEAVADSPRLMMDEEAGPQQETRPIWEELSDEGYDRFMHGLL